MSGVTYYPDGNIGLGVRAKLLLGTQPGPEAFNADAQFEVLFNTNGGLSSVNFRGNGYYMSKVGEGNSSAYVKASVFLDYDVQNKELLGQLETYVNIPASFQGIQAGGKAGTAEIYFSPDDWHIFLGRPDSNQRLGIKYVLFQIQAQMYMCMGTDIPTIPDPPAAIKQILGESFSMQDDLSLRKGSGILLGASLGINTGDLNFLMFYARFEAGMGFDLMLKNYGSDTKCDGSTSPVGINGWYAQGQAYAYLQGKIGIKVDMSFYKGNFAILSIGAAAVLQAKLPNPTWLKGSCGGYFSVLGGLISGKCKFTVELGQKCTISGGSPVAGIKVISECAPPQNENNVDVFSTPQATFTLEIEKPFEIVDINDNKRSIKVVLDYFKVLNGTTEIAGQLEWNDKNDVVAFNAHEILPSEKTVTMKARVHFEEWISGKWQSIYVSGKEAEELHESTFKTGKAPDYIPAGNVAYSYPMMNHANFYTGEYGSGYIQLIDGQSYLFDANNNWTQIVRFDASTGKKEMNFSYDKQAMRLNFNIPSGLSLGTIYKWNVINIPNRATAAVDKNVTSVTSQAFASTDSNKVDLAARNVEGTRDALQEKSIFDANFRSSLYTTFLNKINALTYTLEWTDPVRVGVFEIGKNFSTNEYFDVFEGSGNARTSPLIQFEVIPDNNGWYDKVYNLVYNPYPVLGRISITNRTTATLGVPPLKAITLYQYPNGRKLEETDIQSSSFFYSVEDAAFRYRFSDISEADFFDLSSQAANESLRNTDAVLKKLTTSSYPVLMQGAYKFKMKYILPGSTSVNSEKEMSITNFVK